MPPVLIPVALAAGAATAGVALGVTTVAAGVISVGVTAAAAGVGYLMQPDAPDSNPMDLGVPSEGFVSGPLNSQRDIVVRQAVPPRRFVYGAARIGGVVFFQDNANPYLYIGLVLSDGEIEGVDRVFFGDTEIQLSGGAAAVGSIYYTYFDIETATGSDSQAASTFLTAAFSDLTSDFRQRGVARVVCKLNWGADADSHGALWGDSVEPSLQMRGVLMYDPRPGTQDETDPSTWAYTANPALAVAHALTNAWGVALDASTAIDWDSFGDCADACDATITYNSESVPLFEISGVFQAGADLASQVTAMLQAFGGVLIDVDGKIGCAMDGARSSVWTITDDDILEFGSFDHAGDVTRTYNTIKARYFDGGSDGVESVTEAYEIPGAVATEGVQETTIDLRFTPGAHSAQILAFRELHRSRAGKTFSLTVSDAGLYLQQLDRVTIASDAAPFVDGDYEVVQVDLAQFGAVLQLREYPADAYADPATYLV